ncbi:MAG: 3-methylcrotonyl-CoA carboxylase beta subunit [Blastocatellia bacterium]|jgi:acetyl-CoA carboxylase carboxyltransferase component|nr:3-methylcrotonyl-CoA carboxylase beta subunit [Blastocatellia bacterium]
MKSEAVFTSGFKVRPLSRVAKADSSTAQPQKSEGGGQDDPTSKPHDLKSQGRRSRLRDLTRELRELEAKIRLGGGPDKIEKQHKQGKLTARERIDLLLDNNSYKQEIGLLVAYDEYKGGAPAAGVVTTIGRIDGREVVVVANDATVKAGSWWPETIKKILRAQEIAMRSHVPIIYLVDSAGVNLPYQGGVFPGQYGASRIFYYNSIMRRYLKVPQIAAVMGPCIAGGAYLPALSDVIIMVEGTSFMGLGGANLVKGATGQTIDNETLGGARTHNEISGVAHYRVKDDEECLGKIREFVKDLPHSLLSARGEGITPWGSAAQALTPLSPSPKGERGSEAKTPLEKIYDIIPEDHRQPYSMRELLDCVLDGGHLDEFQADYAKEIITGHARIRGILVGVIANNRGMFRDPTGGAPKFGGIIYTDSAEKVAFFIETCNRHKTPLLFVQDVSGFMVGSEAEHSGIIRAGARFVEAMATALVPKIVLTVNHASGAGYYAMAGQGFDPDFIFTWPSGRMGVMEGDSAVQAVFGSELERLKKNGQEPGPELELEMKQVRQTYERDLDAKYAAARGFVDAVIAPEETRDALELALRVGLNYSGPHLGQFVLPASLA